MYMNVNDWKFRESNILPPEWAKDLSISPAFLKILSGRNFKELSEIETYLSAKKKFLIAPELWPSIPQAAQILAKELLLNKKFVVWGDYDVDGITSTALVLDILEAHGIEADYYLPDRKTDGYGVNIEGIEKLAQKGCEVLLTVDCGVTDCAALEKARELGMTVIVSDHHLRGQTLPNANAICDPKVLVNNREWPCPHLSGVGVTFYLMAHVNQLLSRVTGKKFKLDNCLDLVALGTMADIVALVGQNRILVKNGLMHMGKNPRPGIALLKKMCNMDVAAEISGNEISYRLAPRLNAAGRMEHANLALNLLRAKNYGEAEEAAYILENCNSARKDEENRAFTEARNQALEYVAKNGNFALVLYGKNWHPGVLGIVASRMVDEFYRPTIVLCGEGENLKGSGRSIENFDLHEALAGVSHLLGGFGGHKLAAGLRLDERNLAEFREKFNLTAADFLRNLRRKKTLILDGELDFRNASNHEFLKELEMMEPFGPGNEEPIFLSPPVEILDRTVFGPARQHARLYLQDMETGKKMYAKGWRMASLFNDSMINKKIKIAYTPKIDYYNGNINFSIEIKDFKLYRE